MALMPRLIFLVRARLAYSAVLAVASQLVSVSLPTIFLVQTSPFVFSKWISKERHQSLVTLRFTGWSRLSSWVHDYVACGWQLTSFGKYTNVFWLVFAGSSFRVVGCIWKSFFDTTDVTWIGTQRSSSYMKRHFPSTLVWSLVWMVNSTGLTIYFPRRAFYFHVPRDVNIAVNSGESLMTFGIWK